MAATPVSNVTIRASPPIWEQFANFTNRHPLGIEKTLRLVQAVCTVFSSSIFISHIPHPRYAIKCASAKTQIGLARRYLRFFKFIDCFDAGHKAWLTPASPASMDLAALRKVVSVGKWSFLGIYFFLENLTLLDAMGIWVTSWAQELFIECHKWWFFGLALSIVGLTIDIFIPVPSSSEIKPPAASAEKSAAAGAGKKITKAPQEERDLTPLVKNLIIDSCDIVIPGSVLGWIPASPTQVGIAMIVSTVLASQDIWASVNQ